MNNIFSTVTVLLFLISTGSLTVFTSHLVFTGGYRDGLRFRPEEQITFDPDAFVQSRPPNMQPFLEQLLHLQIFQQFIEERLFQLNSGEGFSDEFEMEANMQADKWGAKSRYQGWLTDMKVSL